MCDVISERDGRRTFSSTPRLLPTQIVMAAEARELVHVYACAFQTRDQTAGRGAIVMTMSGGIAVR